MWLSCVRTFHTVKTFESFILNRFPSPSENYTMYLNDCEIIAIIVLGNEIPISQEAVICYIIRGAFRLTDLHGLILQSQ